MKNQTRAYGRIRVSGPMLGDTPFLTLVFINKKLYNEALRRLNEEGFSIVDHFWGYSYYLDIDKMIWDVETCCGKYPFPVDNEL